MSSFKDADRASYDLVARAWDAHSEELSGRYAPTLIPIAAVPVSSKYCPVVVSKCHCPLG